MLAQGDRLGDPLVDAAIVALEIAAATLAAGRAAIARPIFIRPVFTGAAVVDVFVVGIQRRLGCRGQVLGCAQIVGVGRLGVTVLARGGALGRAVRGFALGPVAVFALCPLVALQKWIALKLLLQPAAAAAS